MNFVVANASSLFITDDIDDPLAVFVVDVNMCSFKKTYVLNVFVKYNNFSLLQKLVVAANHPNCGTVRTVS